MKNNRVNNRAIDWMRDYSSALKRLVRMLFSRRRTRAHFLYLEVTHRCNLRCVACYTGAGIEKDNVLTLEEQKSVVRQAAEMGARTVSLSGSGEPLLYKHLFALIDYIEELRMRVIVFTNGTLIDRRMADSLMARRVMVFFKLYSLDAGIFDRMVGQANAYEWVEHQCVVNGSTRTWRIPSGLKALLDAQRAAGLSGLVRTETLITKVNVHTLPEVAVFCKETDTGLFLETPIFKGKAIENYKDIVVSASAYEELYKQLVAVLGEDYMTAARTSTCSVERNPVVRIDGQIGFCSSRPADVGNVRDEPLAVLFRRAKTLKRKEDRIIAQKARTSRYFRSCHSKQSCELRHDLPCDY